MTRVRLRASGLSQQLLVAFVSGAAGVLAFAPFRWSPVALVSLAILLALWCRDQSIWRTFVIGFAWGLGLFLAGVSWIYVSLHVYGNMPAILAAASTFLFCCYLSLYPALAGGLTRWLSTRLSLGPFVALVLVAPSSFVIFEYLRGWLLTGFPWLTMGYSQAPGGSVGVPLSGFAPLAGVHAISWLLVVSAALLVVLFRPAEGRRMSGRGRAAVALVLAGIWIAGAALRNAGWSEIDGPTLRVALVQGNIAQELKWRADQQEETLRTYAALVRQSTARLIVLPETALPGFLDQIPAEFISRLQKDAQAAGADIVVGVPVAERGSSAIEPYRYANSAITLGVSPSQRYDKQHLVAFGEFMPPLFSWVYRWLQIPLAGFTPGTSEQVPMNISGTRVAVNICYEDAFGREIGRHAAAAGLLVNMSNMAWYGRSLAADQHAQFSQMRALETSRWMLRATNSGVTAAINDKGEIVNALPQFDRGILSIDAQPRKGATPYTLVGDIPALFLAVLALLVAALAGLRSRRERQSIRG